MPVLGMNRRNALIARFNPREAIKGVNQKYETKQRLADAGVPVPPTLALIADESELAGFDFASLPDAFAVKPNRGRRGEGVILVDGRNESGWRQLNGETLTPVALAQHVRLIMSGELSLEGSNSDAALFEPLIRPHRDLARLVPYGLPDIRIICLGDVPLMAMTRLPTEESRGRANLHQGAVGAAIGFADGTIFRGVLGQEEVFDHPSTGVDLIGAAIPFWRETVEAARRCSDALGLGYVGVDLVIDATRGVQVLECNAYPGLEIQNVNAAGLGGRIERVLRDRRERARAERWAYLGRRFAGVRQILYLGTELAGVVGQVRGCLADMLGGAALTACFPSLDRSARSTARCITSGAQSARRVGYSGATAPGQGTRRLPSPL